MTGDFKDISLKEYVLRYLTGQYHVTELWAEKNSFMLEKGDMLGIIGTIGAFRKKERAENVREHPRRRDDSVGVPFLGAGQGAVQQDFPASQREADPIRRRCGGAL